MILQFVPSLAGLFPARRTAPPGRPAIACRKRSARRAVLGFLVLFVLANVVFSVGMDTVFRSVRDPEYGRRVVRYRARAAENPDRPLVVVLGSSRVSMAVRPEFVNGDSGPLVFNFGQVGGGPFTELMTLKRMIQDGIEPKEIIVEYWPPYLHQDGQFSEQSRTDLHRFFTNDESFVREWFLNPEWYVDHMRRIRWNPFYEHRLRILNQIVPSWLVHSRRFDGAWDRLDPWGWLPGYDRDLNATERVERHKLAWDYFHRVFAQYRTDERARLALREIVTLAKVRGMPITILWLPESTEFRAWYPKDVLEQGERAIEAFCREEGISFVDARTWVPDVHLGDGFHLNIPGAEVFSRKLGEYLRSRP
jgi:hypothetical protein